MTKIGPKALFILACGEGEGEGGQFLERPGIWGQGPQLKFRIWSPTGDVCWLQGSEQWQHCVPLMPLASSLEVGLNPACKETQSPDSAQMST